MLGSPDVTTKEIVAYSESHIEWLALKPEDDEPNDLPSQRRWDILNIDRIIESIHFDNMTEIKQERESNALLPSKQIGTLLNINVLCKVIVKSIIKNLQILNKY